MIYHTRAALGLAVAFMFLDMALASTASAQDVMQLDLMFRDSLQRKSPPETQGPADYGRGGDVSAAREPSKVARRHWRRHHHQKT
jgi:hypothetical protein